MPHIHKPHKTFYISEPTINHTELQKFSTNCKNLLLLNHTNFLLILKIQNSNPHLTDNLNSLHIIPYRQITKEYGIRNRNINKTVG